MWDVWDVLYAFYLIHTKDNHTDHIVLYVPVCAEYGQCLLI